VVPPERSLQQTRTVKGGQVAAAGTIGAGAIGAIQETVGQAHEALVGVVSYLDAAKWEPTRHPSTWRLALLSSLPHLHAEAFRLRTSLVSVDCQSRSQST
jgi:hypothetical protein